MLDIKFIKENPELIKEAVRKKHIKFNVNELLRAEEARIFALQEVEALRAEQNEKSDAIGNMLDQEYKARMIVEMQKLKETLKEKESKLSEVMKQWQELMLQVPNIPDMSVPEGESDNDNKEIKVWGEKTVFNFEPKDHIVIMTRLKMVDFERGTKVHGFRGYFLTGDGALLCFAIWNYALEFFLKKNFIPIIPPAIVRKSNFFGTGHLPADVEDYYITQDSDCLIATAEIPLMGFYSNEVLSISDLPKRYLGFSPSFRREAGAYSKDIKGLIRVNEFYKFEQLVLCDANHDISVKIHEELNRNTEEFLESLGLHYRTINACGGNLGRGHVKMYDIELWVPKEEKYREISSASYFHDFQCRRFNIRYKDADGKMRYAHSLNATAIPTPRILVSLVENFQQKDGSIVIPEVLRKYMGGRERIVLSKIVK